MCMEDVKISRSQSATPQNYTVPGDTAQLLAGASNTRSRLIVAISGPGIAHLMAGKDAAANTLVWVLTPDHPGVVLTMEDWGEMIRWSWSILPLADGCEVGVTDVSFEAIR